MVKIKRGQEIKIKAEADVLYVLDVTGSMSDCLENLKKSVLKISKDIVESCEKDYQLKGADIAFNAVGYRDIDEDGEEKAFILMDKDFTQDIEKIENFFSGEEMSAEGGGDAPENALDALYRGITQVAWSRPAKIVVLLTDAPTKKLHPSTTGGVELSEEDGLERLKAEVANRKIEVIVFGPEGVKEYENIGTWERCAYYPGNAGKASIEFFEDEDKFKKRVVDVVVKTVSRSGSSVVKYGG